MRKILLAGAITFLLAAMSVSSAIAAPCSGNGWQPTFVHDLERPDGPWYVMPNLTFVKLRQSGSPPSWVPQACSLIQSNGVRNRRGFTTCQDYTRIQCGCTRNDLSNTTCSAFIRQRP
ncbi:MAG: hypothetical protein HY712_06000 [candidate division NC10 bacterium]|nr:hypothetical protein [candidate division NC10 bacterium]